ncbi:MAG: hypothetical protein N2Z70_05740 [Bdellovibrionaceae bacterium]|nr:hypothetical protein [Pseudobdellovibrionaceae bacterium]
MGQRLNDFNQKRGKSLLSLRLPLVGLAGALLFVGIAFLGRQKFEPPTLITTAAQNVSFPMVTSQDPANKRSSSDQLSKEAPKNSSLQQDTTRSLAEEESLRPEVLKAWVTEYAKLQRVLIKNPQQLSHYQELLRSPEVQQAMRKTLLNPKSSEQEKNTAVDYILELVTQEPREAQALWSAVLEQASSPEHPLWEWQVELAYRLMHHPDFPVSEEELARHWNYSGKKEALARMHLPFDEL